MQCPTLIFFFFFFFFNSHLKSSILHSLFFSLSIPSICVYLSLMNLSSPINEINNSRILSNPSKPHDVFHRSHLSLSSLVTQMANDWSWGFFSTWHVRMYPGDIGTLDASSV
ncbi:hypothetical protein ACN42_g5542 [Penicillium freii]|uniref:Uncharacterized protein n=1 Tax=Penicillium freii TaxID=48697 RepID=A0A101MJA4_PENFR|nr:hypothetical protein ACN42_g5542 [Penicillium freii]